MSQEINENNHVPTIVMEGYLNKRSINKSMGLFHL